ncbi:MAG TPA: glutamate 5-kinase [Limnochordia bacterium]
MAFRDVRRIVVKLGTSTVTRPDGTIHFGRVERIVRQIVDVVNEGREVILVTSGAIGVGASRLGLRRRPQTIPEKQAAAAVGQGLLMQAYEKLFAEYGRVVGQVLLTRADLAARDRFLNSRHTLLTLLAFGVVPIVNENDTVAVEELHFGDNDTLAALVASLVGADIVILLSDVPGLFAQDPRRVPSAPLFDVVTEITAEIERAAGGPGSAFARGGMATKLQAARVAVRAGIPLVLADGERPGVLAAILAGEREGTLFQPRPARLGSRKRWIAFHESPRGVIRVDAGAARALVQDGKSLLPIGVIGVEGSFVAGDLVRICDDGGQELARGLVNYGAREIEKIMGARSDEIAGRLGHKAYDEVVHRDNLAVSV